MLAWPRPRCFTRCAPLMGCRANRRALQGTDLTTRCVRFSAPTNQGVVGSNPAGRASFLLLHQALAAIAAGASRFMITSAGVLRDPAYSVRLYDHEFVYTTHNALAGARRTSLSQATEACPDHDDLAAVESSSTGICARLSP